MHKNRKSNAVLPSGHSLLTGLKQIWQTLNGTEPIGSGRERQAVLTELQRVAQATLSGRVTHAPNSTEEESLIREIKQQTAVQNGNNLTRTEAYLNYYLHHPEVHWALLAHFVSRNGGWNMTDLKAELIARLITQQEAKDFFHFLERCNWLIFQDAYPQLLLYEQSKKAQRDLFHLLPAFRVSRFMRAMWTSFWQTKNAALITHALILNEQQYIEQRVVQHPFYQRQVFQQLPFILQSLLHFNHVLFPYQRQGDDIHLVGTTVEHFPRLTHRIEVGKKLYAILFGDVDRRRKLEDWAQRHPHSGSRADYWPQLFSPERKQNERGSYHFQVQGDRLHQRGDKLYSPRLLDVWPAAIRHDPPQVGDWYRQEQAATWLDNVWLMEKGHPNQMTKAHQHALNKLEVAIVAKQKWNQLT
jgi:hypothetical protein